MNIFSIFVDAREAARWHVDAHMKLALEATQIASTVYWQYRQTPPGPDPYRATHAHHPCVRWACQSLDNFHQVVAYGLALTLEFRRRYRPQLCARHARDARDIAARVRARRPRDEVMAAYRRSAAARPPPPSSRPSDHKCRAKLLAMLARPPAFPAPGAARPAMGEAFLAACGRFHVPLAFRDHSHLFSEDAVRSYRAYYALKYLQKPACRALRRSRRHGLLACAAMALTSRLFAIPPLKLEQETAGKRKRPGGGESRRGGKRGRPAPHTNK